MRHEAAWRSYLLVCTVCTVRAPQGLSFLPGSPPPAAPLQQFVASMNASGRLLGAGAGAGADTSALDLQLHLTLGSPAPAPAPAQPHRHRHSYRRDQLRILRADTDLQPATAAAWGEWGPWSRCSRSCTIRRYRSCVAAELCGAEVLKEQAFCFVEGGFCHRWLAAQERERVRPRDIRAGFHQNEIHALEDGLSDGRASSSGCGVAPNTSDLDTNMLRIVGGRPAPRGAWPWQVAVLNRFREPFCGGTLVSARWVLTAAHCLRRRLYVRVGEHDLARHSGREHDVKVVEQVPHPLYDPDAVDNDVALLRLWRWPAPYPAVPACLPRPRQPLPPGTACTILGWGKRAASAARGTTLLQQVQVPVVSQARCRAAYRHLAISITPSMVCAGAGDSRDACAGDSGGPLLCRDPQRGPGPGPGPGQWQVHGVTSFGDGCGDKKRFGIYARTAAHVRWMRQVMHGHGHGHGHL